MNSSISLRRRFIEMIMVWREKATTVVLLRHGERENVSASNPDPPLTSAGRQRAQALVEVASRASLSAIYVTEFQRTHQAAQPLASILGITPTQFNIGGNAQQHAHDVTADILAVHSGQAVLIVGHSDTVPLVIKALGVSPTPTIGQNEFNRLFIVVKHERGKTRLISACYGA